MCWESWGEREEHIEVISGVRREQGSNRGQRWIIKIIGRFCKENKSAKTAVFCCRCDNAPHVDVLITKILLSGIGIQVNLSQITVGLK